jgi:hypothetical protein
VLPLKILGAGALPRPKVRILFGFGESFPMVDTTHSTQPPVGLQSLLDHVAADARKAGVFDGVTVTASRLEAAAKGAAAPAHYRLDAEQGVLWVSLVMADRWLSHSIEADLLHTGDDLEDLIAEELIELGEANPARPPCEHFRSEEKLFTFRSCLGLKADAAGAKEQASRWLLAYEACFRALGEMDEAEE